MSTAGAQDLETWADSEPTFPERLKDRLFRLWYHGLGTLLHTETSAIRVFGFLIKVAAVIGIASAPFWIEYLKTQTIGGWQAAIMTAVLASLLFVSWIHDRLKESYSISTQKRDCQRRLALRHEQTINKFVGSVHFVERSEDHTLAMIQKILCCVEECVRLNLEKFDAQYFQATLLLFIDDGQRIQIAERAKANRGTGGKVASQRCLAYYVARANRVKAIHDMKRQRLVESKGLSDDSLPYRSILFLPITSDSPGDQTTVCNGVVTIDSSRPYEFWGPVASDIAVQVMPFVRLIAILIQDHPDGVKVGG